MNNPKKLTRWESQIQEIIKDIVYLEENYDSNMAENNVDTPYDVLFNFISNLLKTEEKRWVEEVRELDCQDILVEEGYEADEAYTSEELLQAVETFQERVIKKLNSLEKEVEDG